MHHKPHRPRLINPSADGRREFPATYDRAYRGRIREELEHDFAQLHPDFYRAKQARSPAESRVNQPFQPDRRLRLQDRALLIIGIVLATLLLIRIEVADAQVIEPAQSAATTEPLWGLSLQPGEQQNAGEAGAFTQPLALDTSIEVDASGLLARVHVLQSFRNSSPLWMEGQYRFPLPDGAAVDRLFIKVGERVLEGEIQERESAARVYQEAKAAGKTASLVEQERRNQFVSKLANIGPGETIHIMIAYLVSIDYADGKFSFSLPNTFNRRYGREIQPGTGLPAPHPQHVAHDLTDSHGLSVRVNLNSTLPLASIESQHHDIDIVPVEGGFQIELVDPDARTDRPFELVWTPGKDEQPQAALSTWTDGGDYFAQLMLVPPQDQALLPMPREVIFVIDTSGSMEGASMDQARAALRKGIDALQPGDQFNVIQFNNTSEALFAQPVESTIGNRSKALRFVDKLDAEGGTEMSPALSMALRNNAADGLLRQVVFITDGSIGNEGELLTQVADELGESRLFTVGIGSAPNSWFMRRAAEIGRGHHTRVARLQDVEQVITDLWEHIRLPAIADLCIDWGVQAESYPEILPDLYAGQPLWVVARLDEAPNSVSLCGELNGSNWSHTAFPQLQSGDETLATLWAQRKIEALQDGLIFGTDPDLTREEITAVALRYQLLTPHTSLVAVDRTPARPLDQKLAMGNVPSLLPAGSTTHAAGFPATATGWQAQVALSLLILMISTALLFNPFSPLSVLHQLLARVTGSPANASSQR